MIRKVRCRVESLTHHGDHVFSVGLALQTPAPPFKPGQFLHFTLDEYDPSSHWPESRALSIASSARDANRVQVLYTVKGQYTRRMEQELHVGTTVWIKLPYGEFVIDDTRDAVLMAGGTGISAFTAFLETLKPGHPGKVLLAYGARTPELMIYRPTILRLVAQAPCFSAVLFSERETSEFVGAQDTAARERLGHRLGRINVEAIWSLLPDPSKHVYYLSGPPQMLTALSAELRERGLPPESIRMDAWE